MVCGTLDRELHAFYRLQFTLNDQNGQQVFQHPIHVGVGDLNDWAPEWSQPLYRFLFNRTFGMMFRVWKRKITMFRWRTVYKDGRTPDGTRQRRRRECTSTLFVTRDKLVWDQRRDRHTDGRTTGKLFPNQFNLTAFLVELLRRIRGPFPRPCRRPWPSASVGDGRCPSWFDRFRGAVAHFRQTVVRSTSARRRRNRRVFSSGRWNENIVYFQKNKSYAVSWARSG